jgi:hypothetical protein
MKLKNNSFLVGLGVMAFMAIGSFYLASNVVPNALISLTQASPGLVVSMSESLVLGNKMVAVADGIDKASVNVFVRDKSGKPVPKRAVEMTGMDGIAVVGSNFSNTDGKVSFEISSKVEGVFPLEASIDGIPLSKGVSVTFRK